MTRAARLPLDSRTTWVTVLLCALGAIVEGFDLQAAGVAAGGIVAEFKPDSRHLGIFFSASTLGLVGGALLGGRMADRIGRRGVLIASVAAFGLFSILTAYASTMAALTAARLLTGLGLGGAFPILVALTAESSEPARRRSNVALVYSAMPLGGAFVSLLSTLIGPLHWRQIFMAGGIAPLLIAPVMARYLEESRAFREARAAGASSSARGGGFRAVFAGGLAANTLLLWVSFFFCLLTLYLLLNWLPTLLLGYGLNKPQASFAQIAFNFGGSVASLCIGRLLDSANRRASAVVVFAAIPLLLLGLSSAPKQASLIVLMVLTLGTAVIASQAVMYALAPACYPTAIRGAGVGSAVAMGRSGSIVGPYLAGALLATGRTTSQLFGYLVPISLMGGVCALWLLWKLSSTDPATHQNPT